MRSKGFTTSRGQVHPQCLAGAQRRKLAESRVEGASTCCHQANGRNGGPPSVRWLFPQLPLALLPLPLFPLPLFPLLHLPLLAHAPSLTLLLVVMIRTRQLKTKIYHAHFLILSLLPLLPLPLPLLPLPLPWLLRCVTHAWIIFTTGYMFLGSDWCLWCCRERCCWLRVCTG